ncbi:MAG: GNAT family N-acetyltransferase [Myxococcales bacterium]|nr:GNAT family N-acetyltransferase [Myxococcales bacterium]
MTWQQRYANKRTTAADAITLIPRGHDIFISSGAAEPEPLVEQLVAQADRFERSVIVHLLTLGSAPYVEAKYGANFRHKAFFIGPNVRKAVHEGRADYTPVFLSQIPQLIRSRRMPVDVALIQCTPPDRSGYVNLGVSVDIVLAAVQSARLVIAQVNPDMPVIHGSGFIPMDVIDAWFVEARALPEVAPAPLDDTARQIGRNVARLVEDGATLQMGIGQIPDAVLEQLHNHRELGVWTEMFSDGVIDLIENGNITNRYCRTNPDRVSSSFTFGTKRLYDYVDNNPLFTFHPSDRINDPLMISRQERMVAINSALQIDLTGQVCADSIGGRFYSGIGGQVDFVRGASMCPGGKPIIAIRATAKNDTISRIVPLLDHGAGVVTSRGDVHYVVTEFGVADLKGRSVRARALALAGIAHPDFRGELLAAARQRRYIPVRASGEAGGDSHDDAVIEASRFENDPGALEQQFDCFDGRKVLIRPLGDDDIEAARAFVDSLVRDENFRRWMSISSEELPERVRLFREAPRDAVTVVAENTTEGSTELVALGYYMLDKATEHAELGLLVSPAWRGQLIGSHLLGMLARVARQHGVLGLSTWAAPEDGAYLRLLHNLGLPLTSVLREGRYRVRITLPRRDRLTHKGLPAVLRPS